MSFTSPGLPSWAPNWFQQTTWVDLNDARKLLPCRFPGITHQNPPEHLQATSSYQGFQPCFSPIPFSASKSLLAEQPTNEDANVLRVKSLFLGTISSCSSLLTEKRPEAKVIPRPRSLRSRYQMWRAMFFLFTFTPESTDRVARQPPIEFPRPIRGSRIVCILRAACVFTAQAIAGRTMLCTALAEHAEMRRARKDVAEFLRQNSQYKVFDTPLATAIQSPIVAFWYLAEVRLGILLMIISFAVVACGWSFWISRRAAWTAFGILLGILAVVASVFLCGSGGRMRREAFARKQRHGRAALIQGLGMRLACGDFGIGWVNERAQPGDKVALLLGCSVPVVLRQYGDDGYSTLR